MMTKNRNDRLPLIGMAVISLLTIYGASRLSQAPFYLKDFRLSNNSILFRTLLLFPVRHIVHKSFLRFQIWLLPL